MSTEGITRNKFLNEAYKRVGKTGSRLFEKYGTKGHWCMMMVYDFMHDVCGISNFPKTFSCSGFTATDFAQKRLNHDYKTAEIGDIILFEINGNRADGADHVGIVIDNTGSSIKLLEGNTNGDEDGLYYDSSTVNVFEYPYSAGCFDCIIDMSEFFTVVPYLTSDTESKHPPDETEAEEKPQDVFTLKLRTLRKGMKGNDVKALQRLLFADGYSVGPCGDDGDFGKRTEKAVIKYQTAHNLTADGIAGKATFTELLKS